MMSFKNLKPPKINKLFENGRRISYGARALNEGDGIFTRATFPGGALIGCDAGT